MRLVTKVRRRVLAWAMVAGIAVGTVAGPGAAQAAPATFDPRNGEVTIGEIVTLVEKDLGKQLGDPALVLGAQSERALSAREVNVLLDGGEVPGFTVLERVKSPKPDLPLKDLGYGTIAKDAKEKSWTFVLDLVVVQVVTHCSTYEGEDYELTVCETTII